jgi:hypothetical protein
VVNGCSWEAIAATRGRLTERFSCSKLTEARELLDGKHEISQFCVPGIGKMSLHADIAAAKNTISRIRVLERHHAFHVALAHDAAWMKDGVDKVLMSLLDEGMAYAARTRISNGEMA